MPIFDQPWHGRLAFFRFRSNARAYGEIIESGNSNVRMVGIAAVIGKKPYVQQYFAENHRDRWDRNNDLKEFSREELAALKAKFS